MDLWQGILNNIFLQIQFDHNFLWGNEYSLCHRRHSHYIARHYGCQLSVLAISAAASTAATAAITTATSTTSTITNIPTNITIVAQSHTDPFFIQGRLFHCICYDFGWWLAHFSFSIPHDTIRPGLNVPREYLAEPLCLSVTMEGITNI